MQKITKILKSKIQRYSKNEDRLSILHGAYFGETCYILTCGPSIRDIWNERIRDILNDKLVISIKQAYDLSPDIMDFHLLNVWNYKKYDYHNKSTIIVMGKQNINVIPDNIVYDMLFNICDNTEKTTYPLAKNRNFDDYLFTKSLVRPWGPGIIYELGIYLAIHLGVTEIVMIGWDIGEKGGIQYRHFYDDDNRKTDRNTSVNTDSNGLINILWHINYRIKKRGFNIKPIIEILPKSLINKVSSVNYSCDTSCDPHYYSSNVNIYNVPIPLKGEEKLIAESTRDLYYWLQTKNINIKIVSENSLADPCIPRVQL